MSGIHELLTIAILVRAQRLGGCVCSGTRSVEIFHPTESGDARGAKSALGEQIHQYGERPKLEKIELSLVSKSLLRFSATKYGLKVRSAAAQTPLLRLSSWPNGPISGGSSTITEHECALKLHDSGVHR